MEKSKKPEISIIMPVYNAGEYLDECLNSIVPQDMENWEAICIDDGSTDDSPDILARRAEKDVRGLRCGYQRLDRAVIEYT